MRRRGRQARQGRINSQGARQASKGIARDGVSTKLRNLRMFGQEAPKQHQLSPQQVGTWLAAALGGDHEGNDVGGVSVVGRKASSNGKGKL